MPNSRLLSLLVFGVAFALGVASCSQDTQEGESGSLSLQLTIAGDLEIDEVAWVITGGDMPSMNGTIDTSAPGSTASIEVYGLPPSTGQDYRITMEAIATDGVTTCKGSEDFGIDVGEVTEIMVFLNCKRPQRLGSVRVNGKFNICAQLIKATAAPLQTSVGNDIDLTSQAEDADDDPIAYNWSATSGSLDDRSAASTTYTCTEVGDHFITISVTDNDEYCDMAMWRFPVTCVPLDAECQSDDDCDEDEMCVAGRCVPDVECVTPADCDDENDCTANICADGTCANPNSDADEMCDQSGGSVCDGQGNCVECNSDAQCDAGEVCFENACVLDDACDMDTDCLDGNQCTVDLCTAGECSNPNEEQGADCDQDGGSVCDDDGNCVECNEGNDCDMGEVCIANTCVADVECMENDECGVDEVCVANTCVSDPEVFCNEGLCLTSEAARAACIDTFLTCVAAEPANEEQCLALGLAECNVECVEAEDCDMGEVCIQNECVADGGPLNAQNDCSGQPVLVGMFGENTTVNAFPSGPTYTDWIDTAIPPICEPGAGDPDSIVCFIPSNPCEVTVTLVVPGGSPSSVNTIAGCNRNPLVCEAGGVSEVTVSLEEEKLWCFVGSIGSGDPAGSTYEIQSLDDCGTLLPF